MVLNTTQKVEMDLLDQVTTIVVAVIDMEIEIHTEQVSHKKLLNAIN